MKRNNVNVRENAAFTAAIGNLKEALADFEKTLRAILRGKLHERCIGASAKPRKRRARDTRNAS